MPNGCLAALIYRRSVTAGSRQRAIRELQGCPGRLGPGSSGGRHVRSALRGLRGFVRIARTAAGTFAWHDPHLLRSGLTRAPWLGDSVDAISQVSRAHAIAATRA